MENIVILGIFFRYEVNGFVVVKNIPMMRSGLELHLNVVLANYVT